MSLIRNIIQENITRAIKLNPKIEYVELRVHFNIVNKLLLYIVLFNNQI